MSEAEFFSSRLWTSLCPTYVPPEKAEYTAVRCLVRQELTAAWSMSPLATPMLGDTGFSHCYIFGNLESRRTSEDMVRTSLLRLLVKQVLQVVVSMTDLWQQSVPCNSQK